MRPVPTLEPLQVYRGTGRPRVITGDLPRVSEEVARTGPLWFGVAFPTQLDTRLGPCAVQHGAVGSVAAGAHVRVDGKIGTAEFSVSVPKADVDRLLTDAGLLPGDRQVDPFVQALVLEHVFGPMISTIEASTGLDLCLTTVTDLDGADVTGLPLRLTVGTEGQITAFFAMGHADLARFLPAPDPIRTQALFRETVLPVSLCAGAMWITANELAEWKAGDLILFTAGKPPQDPMLCIAGGAVAQVRPSGEALVLLTPFRRPMSPNLERNRQMQQGNVATAPDVAPEDDTQRALDDVALLVSFDLGQRSMTLAELGELAVGNVFEIGSPSSHQVKIRANGSVVGSGRLVRIDDRLGVQIVAMQTSNV